MSASIYHKSTFRISFLKVVILLHDSLKVKLQKCIPDANHNLMPNITFIHIFNGLLQEMVLCKCLKRFSNRGHLGISPNGYLKMKNQRWKHTRHYWVHIDKGFPPCRMLLPKKLWRFHIFELFIYLKLHVSASFFTTQKYR